MLQRLILVTLAMSALLCAQQPPERLWSSCQSCHVQPDAAIAGDQSWLERLKSTACIQPGPAKSAALRSTLKSWLLSAERVRPRRIESTLPAQADEGTLAVPFAEGSLWIVPADATTPLVPLRLVWSAASGGARAIPAGKWRVSAYRLRQRDAEGTEWQLWASGGAGREFAVQAGQESKLEVDQSVTTRLDWSMKGQDLRIGVNVRGDSDMGATIVRGGERVPMRFVVRDGVSTAVAGDLDYG